MRAVVPLADGGTATIEAKVRGWTDAVLIHWQDDEGRVHKVWVAAEHVTRISREESSWRDPYDKV